MLQNDGNTHSWVKDTKTLKASPMNGKHQKHPSVDQKLPKKLPHEFRSSTKSPVKYSIIEGLPCKFETQRQPLHELQRNFPMEQIRPPCG